MTKGAFFYAFGFGVLLGIGGLHQLPQISLALVALGSALFILTALCAVFLNSIPSWCRWFLVFVCGFGLAWAVARSEEHTSELQSRGHLVCRLLLEKKNEHRQYD